MSIADLCTFRAQERSVRGGMIATNRKDLHEPSAVAALVRASTRMRHVIEGNRAMAVGIREMTEVEVARVADAIKYFVGLLLEKESRGDAAGGWPAT